jgi:hypothetical protein
MRLNDRSPRVPGAWLLHLYPRAWRQRYETEMLAVLEARPLTFRTRVDLARGALDAHLHPAVPPSLGLVAPVVAGVAWITAGGATLAESTPPDWPGYLLWTLPLGLLGAGAGLRIVLTVGLGSGMRAPAASGAALLLALAGYAFWVAALAVAVVGGPYGAITGAAQSIAAVGTIAVGLVRWRATDHPLAEAVLIAGAAMLVPTPAAWIVAGAAWLALAVVARPRIDLRPA